MPDYNFHPQAIAELDEIWEYIALDNLTAADGIIVEVMAAVQNAAYFPAIGHMRPDLTSRPLRFLVIREYLIAYAPDESPLWVIAIMHGRRNPRVLAALLRSRS